MVVTSKMRNDVIKRNNDVTKQRSDITFPNLDFSENSLPSMVVSSNNQKTPKKVQNLNEQNDIDLFGGFSDLKPPVIVEPPTQKEFHNDAAKFSNGM